MTAAVPRIALAFATVLMLGLCALLARAQSPTEQTTLVRALVAEADWSAADHVAILHVLKRRADHQGVTIEAMALRYVSAFRVPATPRTRWIVQLEAACTQPEAWPAHLAWSAYEQRCRDTFERVRAFAAEELRDPCPGAWHWGARDLREDVLRAAVAGWRVVDCGATANRFYGRTRYEPGAIVEPEKPSTARKQRVAR